MKITLALPDVALRQARAVAADRGVTLKQFVIIGALIEDEFEKLPSDEVA